ncbi:polycystic kidney disease 1 like 1 [Electrophorus electricus]|uniref:polycystic kidney disease 1 like 1 n=1 Tax=Electrophorus electricus TaxID=8005 RepID=UPI0015CFBAEF|nr:polycystic kidney disease 1 like 1 [Electrophorus electricus]
MCFSAVRVYTEKQAYATGVNISFVAVTAEPDPLEFHWQFGDSVTVVTTSRRFIKSYALPDRYNVSVSLSNGHYCASSAVYRVVIQHVVQLTRLRYSPTALPNTAVQLICRGRPATDVTYLWDFGDGIQRFGQGIVHHVYNRTGEFVIKVTVSNLVSSASLQGHLFVVSEPCKPPPVKNMGPSLIQVWRYQPVQLSVTYEAPIQCRVSRGLLYSWSLCDRGGQPLHIPLTDTNKQYLHLPEYFLHYGTYKVLAKVQVAGSIVYSNYSVLLEVRPSPPVSTITGATHLFLSRHDSNAIITLDGRGSHDPDFPDNVMSYSWKCTAVNTAESLCFTEPVPTSFAVLAFPVNVLRTRCDLFKFTLTVHSGWRSASSDMFITVRSKPSRIIQMSCEECRGNSVNWNEQLAVTAACESCPGNITYSWQLYLVKASHRALAEVPFCSSVDIRSASDTGGTAFSSQQSGEAVPMSGSFLNDYLHTTAVSALSNEASISNDDVPDVKAVPHDPYDLDEAIRPSDVHQGDNVVGPNSLGRGEPEKTLLDLPRELIQPLVFESLTYTGTSSPVVTFKPSMLKPKSLYMLEVSASKSEHRGKAQLFLPTWAAPEGVACQVQPSTGLEMHTHFSIFCSTGQQDLIYEFSFSVGSSPSTRLYKGRNYQHYFSLPSGDPDSDYTVTIFIKIGNRLGALTRPCPVSITVLPSFQRTSSPHSTPEEELFVYGLGNLTNLMQTRNDRDIINYISLLTGVLNRLSQDPQSSAELQKHTRAALISAGCHVTITSQDLLLDVLHAISDLMKVSNQVTFGSAKLIMERTRDIQDIYLRESSLPYRVLDAKVLNALVHVLSCVLDVPALSSTLGIQLTRDALHITSDVVLMYMQSSKDSEYSVNSTFMKLMAWHCSSFPTPVKTINGTTFYIPNTLETDINRGSSDNEQAPCFITRLVSYKQNPFHWQRAPKQLVGGVVDIKVFNCTTRREVQMKGLSAPVVIEFQKRERSIKRGVSFTLMQREVNTHQFDITPELLHKALQVTVEFRRPSSRIFPVLMLFRIHKRPTPTLYNIQEVYRWKGQAAQIFLPPLSLKDAGTGYLMILNADFNKSSRNRYISKAVNYTLSIQAIECLAWDGLREWRPNDCSVLPGLTWTKINCSVSACLTPCVMAAVCTALYAVMLVFGKDADGRMEQNSSPLLLPDNKPSDHFLYAITTDTGLRSAASMTAKVYIVLYGENGLSQTRELSSPDHKLFTRNSRNTFILSAPQSLGRVWQVHLWHDNGGASPSWFLSHVVVKDMVEGRSWLFPGQCWLAVDEGDGRVERRLQEQELPFREALTWNLTECLEDFHPWLSAYSRPSYSTHTHVQRLSVCFLLLQAYMCANAVLVHFHEEQYSSELGLIDVSPVSMTTGLCGLALLPLGSLVSCLFRISKILTMLLCDGLQSVPDWMTPGFVSCTQQADSSTLHRSAESSSAIEVIEENVPNGSDKLQGRRFTCSSFDFQSGLAVNAFSSTHDSSRKCSTLLVWCYSVAWALWLFLSLTCIVVTGTLGLKFSSTKSLLWIQSVFFSLFFCVFAVHPAMGYFIQCSTASESTVEQLKHHRPSEACFCFISCQQPEVINKHFEKVLAARQRARHLRLVHPPTSAELKSVRHQFKRRTLLRKTIRSEAFGVLKELWATGWTGRHSHAVAIQFTLYSPLYGLFSTVTVLGERTHPGRLVSSSFIHAARLGHAATPLSYWLVATELLFLFLTLLHASFLTCVIAQRGWPYWTDIQNLLEVVILLVSLISFICTVHHFTLKEDMIENLQRDNYKTFVDLSLLSFWEQFTRVICGVLLFLLLIKFCLLLRIHESVDSAASAMTFIFPNMLWSLIAGVILLIAFSCLGNLLFHSQPSVFSTLSRSVYFSIAHSCGVGKLRDLEQPHHRSQSLILEEFEDLLDELLLRLSSVSDNQEPQNLPYTERHCSPEVAIFSAADLNKTVPMMKKNDPCVTGVSSCPPEDCIVR